MFSTGTLSSICHVQVYVRTPWKDAGKFSLEREKK